MLNRLRVMIPEDQKRFWELQGPAASNLVSKLTAFLEHIDCSSSARITANLQAFPWLRHYVTLYHSFARMTSTHDGIIEKYIRRLSKSMKPKLKQKLVSSPDHGTTYMKPKSTTVQRPRLRLPSLDTIAQIRRNHLLKEWVKPVKAMEATFSTPTEAVDWFYSRNN